MTTKPKLTFDSFRVAVDTQFQLMATSGTLVTVNIDPNDVWDYYLKSFPEGTNPMFRERTEYDCNCCKNFVRNIGNVVSISSNGIQTIWDVAVPEYFQDVADSMATYIRTGSFSDYYVSSEKTIGYKPNSDNSSDIIWDHFRTTVPRNFIVSAPDKASILGELRNTKDVFKRGLEDLSLESAEIVLELIDQGSLYRGVEFKPQVVKFIANKKQYEALGSDIQKDIFIWTASKKLGMASRFRSSVIGTLIEDLSEGKELDYAVKSFESKTAPTNYKRSSALISKGMIQQAQETIKELGLEDSLQRRFAVPADISVNNVLFSSAVEKPLDVFGDLLNTASNAKPKALSKVEEISIDKFITTVLPTATKVEALFENTHINNLVTLVAPAHPESKNLMKWSNPFSWAYNGDITDSIKERVKAAGGTVEAALRISLAWFNFDDLDLHVEEPNGNLIYFGNRNHPSQISGGKLDVDMNAGGRGSREAVENIVFPDKQRLRDGLYKVRVNNFCKRESVDVGFDIQIEANGVITNLNYSRAVSDKDNISICNVLVKNGNCEIVNLHKFASASSSSKEVWNVNTETFLPVSTIMNSPNHWDNESVGNKHVFFVLAGCKNLEPVRGFFNEFISDELTKHRKVFEVLGSKLKAEPTEEQVSGIGFSETLRKDLTVRVTGKTQRTFVIKF